MSSPNLLGTA
jgi:plastocyanin